ncbi:hypothetical protein FB45DRAFT_1126833 [Roridomyces roridus]|uniref:Uncharacterized protein n=1 Tax=Roridomyces roridus TaxID=1738132 RepID=A0AAD7B4G1_9AGAR|nr:hypothetical protein FB45DRAFT_1126833 [Roridomyces roridus]
MGEPSELQRNHKAAATTLTRGIVLIASKNLLIAIQLPLGLGEPAWQQRVARIFPEFSSWRDEALLSRTRATWTLPVRFGVAQFGNHDVLFSPRHLRDIIVQLGQVLIREMLKLRPRISDWKFEKRHSSESHQKSYGLQCTHTIARSADSQAQDRVVERGEIFEVKSDPFFQWFNSSCSTREPVLKNEGSSEENIVTLPFVQPRTNAVYLFDSGYTIPEEPPSLPRARKIFKVSGASISELFTSTPFDSGHDRYVENSDLLFPVHTSTSYCKGARDGILSHRQAVRAPTVTVDFERFKSGGVLNAHLASTEYLSPVLSVAHVTNPFDSGSHRLQEVCYKTPHWELGIKGNLETYLRIKHAYSSSGSTTARSDTSGASSFGNLALQCTLPVRIGVAP